MDQTRGEDFVLLTFVGNILPFLSSTNLPFLNNFTYWKTPHLCVVSSSIMHCMIMHDHASSIMHVHHAFENVHC